MATEPTEPGNFSAALVLTIELLKRGAPVVDMHRWGLRVRKFGEDWSISTIPQYARGAHADLEFDELVKFKQGEKDVGSEIAGVGAAPEDD